MPVLYLKSERDEKRKKDDTELCSFLSSMLPSIGDRTGLRTDLILSRPIYRFSPNTLSPRQKICVRAPCSSMLQPYIIHHRRREMAGGNGGRDSLQRVLRDLSHDSRIDSFLIPALVLTINPCKHHPGRLSMSHGERNIALPESG